MNRNGLEPAIDELTQFVPPVIAKRLVFHLGGYDATSPEAAHRRFTRETRRFESTWSAKAAVSAAEISTDVAAWRIMSSGTNWHVETEFRLVRWDDIVATSDRRPPWRQIPLGLIAFVDFIMAGALWGYLRHNWRYAGFFLYPFFLFGALASVAALTGYLTESAGASRIVGIAAGGLALGGLLQWPGQALHLPRLFGDWIFARTYIRHGNPVLNTRLDRAARDLVAEARKRDTDEILVVGHSLGAVLAVDVIDRALELEPSLGRSGPRLVFLSIGSSILKIGLHRTAGRFRAAVERVAATRGVFWAEYQALSDVMNFYKTDPIAALGLTAPRRPLVRVVRISRMLNPAVYKRIRLNFFRMHCQFVSGNDQRAIYDYFMLVCGPLSAMKQACSTDGAISAIGTDGTCLAIPPKWQMTHYASAVGAIQICLFDGNPG